MEAVVEDPFALVRFGFRPRFGVGTGLGLLSETLMKEFLAQLGGLTSLEAVVEDPFALVRFGFRPRFGVGTGLGFRPRFGVGSGLAFYEYLLTNLRRETAFEALVEVFATLVGPWLVGFGAGFWVVSVALVEQLLTKFGVFTIFEALVETRLTIVRGWLGLLCVTLPNQLFAVFGGRITLDAAIELQQAFISRLRWRIEVGTVDVVLARSVFNCVDFSIACTKCQQKAHKGNGKEGTWVARFHIGSTPERSATGFCAEQWICGVDEFGAQLSEVESTVASTRVHIVITDTGQSITVRMNFLSTPRPTLETFAAEDVHSSFTSLVRLSSALGKRDPERQVESECELEASEAEARARFVRPADFWNTTRN